MEHGAIDTPVGRLDGPGVSRAAERPAPVTRSSSNPIEETAHGNDTPAQWVVGAS
jgi:hypothetical protein